MATGIKLFRIVQKIYKTIGLNILPCQSQHHSNFNEKFFLLFIFPAQFFISSIGFFLFEAETADEYGLSFYVSISMLRIIIDILNIGLKMEKISTLIGKYEEFIDKSLFWICFLNFSSNFHNIFLNKNDLF